LMTGPLACPGRMVCDWFIDMYSLSAELKVT
jgi:hypothetical protein